MVIEKPKFPNLNEIFKRVRKYKDILTEERVTPNELSVPSTLSNALWLCERMIYQYEVNDYLLSGDAARWERWADYIGEVLRKNQLI